MIRAGHGDLMAIEDEPTATPQTTPAGSPGRGGTTGAALRVCAGAACISVSAGFVELSGVVAGTAAFFRCALALLVLAPAAITEYRRVGPRPPRRNALDLAAGVLLGIDMVCWAASIHEVGAGIATVLINVQVVVFPLLARVFSGVRLSGRFWLTVPVMLTGVGLAAGVVGPAALGTDPAAGAALGCTAGAAYAGYLFLMRLGGGTGHTVGPVCVSSASAAATTAVLGGVSTGIDLSPGWPALGWLGALSLSGQVLAWLLITSALPRLAPAVGASLLLCQPVLALVFGFAVLHEQPTMLQLTGCAVVIAAVWHVGRAPRGA